MQIQTKNLEESPVIHALKSSRNANEAITVLNRVNTNMGALKKKFSNIDNLHVSDALQALTFCLDSLVALHCARSVIQLFSDKKRDRCIELVDVMSASIKDFKDYLINTLDKVCSPRMDKHLNYLADTAFKLLSRYGSTTQLHIRLNDYQMICFYTEGGATDKQGYTSGPICVKLVYDGSYRISFPDNPFVDGEMFLVDGAEDVKNFITSNISDFVYKGPCPETDSVMAQDIVKETLLHKDCLEVVLKPSATPSDITLFLRKVVPYFKELVGTNQEILHRVSQYGQSRSISFMVGKRKIASPMALRKVSRLVGLSASKISSIMVKK